MNTLKLYEHDKFGKIRCSIINGEVYFKADDILSVLKFSDGNIIKEYISDDDKITVSKTDSVGRCSPETLINTFGLHSLMIMKQSMLSGSVDVLGIKSWIHKTVIPAVRNASEDKLSDYDKTILSVIKGKTEQDRVTSLARLLNMIPEKPVAEKKISSYTLKKMRDVTHEYNLKQGQISLWAIHNNYIVRNSITNNFSVNESGAKYFKADGKKLYITSEGYDLIQGNIHDIKVIKTNMARI